MQKIGFCDKYSLTQAKGRRRLTKKQRKQQLKNRKK